MKLNNWSKIELGDVASYSNEKTPINKVDEYNYISTENMLNDKQGVRNATSLPRSKFVKSYKEADILISNIRPYFKKIWFADKSGGCSNDILVIRPNNNINSKYLYYQLSSNSFFHYMTATSKGTKMPRGDKQVVMRYQMNLSTTQSQIKIANILKLLDDKIEVNKRIIDKLEDIVAQIFEHYFSKNYTKNERQIVKLSDISEINYGKNLPTNRLLNQGYKVFGGNGMIGYYSEYLYKDHKILISCRGAASGLVRISRPYSFVTNNSLIINEHKKYYYPFLRQLCLRRNFFDFVTGSAQPQLTIKSLESLEISLPSSELLMDFNKKVISFYKIEEIFTQENENLVKLRDTLLPKLMSGEIEV